MMSSTAASSSGLVDSPMRPPTCEKEFQYIRHSTHAPLTITMKKQLITSAAFRATDVERLLEVGDVEFDEYRQLWDLAARVAVQVPVSDFRPLVRQSICRLMEEGHLGPLSVLLDGLLRYGTASHLGLLRASELQPMLQSTREDIREFALELLGRWPAPAE